ncbi:MAG TPA: universal stress protein, partial [Terriglobales bacterium]|nr:universal stress protein [Terriglobales bacterium]
MSAGPKPVLIPRKAISPQALEIRNVLFTTDFGASSQAALPYACAIARRYGAKMHVLHVIPPEPRLAVPIDRYPAELDTARQDATEQMEGLLSQDVLKGLPQCALVERG